MDLLNLFCFLKTKQFFKIFLGDQRYLEVPTSSLSEKNSKEARTEMFLVDVGP